MKSKKSRILGVALTLAMLASLFVFAVPVAAEPGNMEWLTQTLPTATDLVMNNGSEPVDFAVANDGTTIYAIDTNVLINASGAILKSTDAGQSWTATSIPSGATANITKYIAVAPDNPLAVAVVEVGIGPPNLVHISNNGGITWATLPAFGTAAEVRDIAVGPARSGTIFGREYVVALADPANAVALGDVQIIGGSAAWATAGNAGVANGQYDYMAVEFSIGFLGDRCVVAVGANDAEGSVLQIINTATGAEVRTPVVLDAGHNDFGDSDTAADAIVDADVTLPSNFDPTTALGETSYVSTASATTVANDGIFRVDADVSRELGLSGASWKSVTYNGTTSEGILFAGTYASNNLRYTINPTVSSPTWVWTMKAPEGVTGRTLLEVAADYATTGRVFATTLGVESAFSISNNGGVSFDQVSLIDNNVANNVVNIDGIALTPDGSTIFVATDDGTDLSLYKSALPVTTTSWSRVFYSAGEATGMLRLNPAWDDAPVIFFGDAIAGGNIYVSVDGGDTWDTRLAPTGITAAALGVQDGSILYLGDALGNVYRSINASWTWSEATPALAGAIISLAVPAADHLLVGGTGAVSYSTDAGTSFTLIDTGLNAADTLLITPDEAYATNNLIYAGDSSATTDNLYRFWIGTSITWEDMANPTGVAIVDVAMNNGALYSMSANDCDRALNPHDAVGDIDWATADAPATFAVTNVANFAAVGNMLYGASAADDLYAYDDWLATSAPAITSPSDGYAVAVDPVTGRGDLVYLTWAAMGSSTGLVDVVDVRIWETALGEGAATEDATNALTVATAPSVTLGAAGAIAYTLLANTQYTWKARGSDQVSNDGLNSPWSDEYTLNVQAGGRVTEPQYGPILQGPIHGATDVSVNPGFSWAPIFGATLYEFILALDAGLTLTVEDTPVYVTTPSWQVPAGTLEYDTTYFWGVKATEPTESPQSIGTFQTLSIDVFTCPYDGETFTTAGALDSHIAAVHPAATPGYIWAIIVIGAVLMIAVIMLILKTRRVA